jgi:hypothetical protein
MDQYQISVSVYRYQKRYGTTLYNFILDAYGIVPSTFAAASWSVYQISGVDGLITIFGDFFNQFSTNGVLLETQFNDQFFVTN